MIFTSYFGALNKIPSNFTPISIAAKPIKGWKGKEYRKLAPSYDILMEYKKTNDTNKYIERYYDEILLKLNPHQVYKELMELVDFFDYVVLICYEKPSDFCHRHLVSKWLRYYGYDVREIYFD